MEELIILNDKMEIEINPILLTISVFDKFWKKHKDKNKALKEIAFLWYLCSKSKKNPFYHEFIGLPIEDKIKAISKDIFELDDYTIHKELKACIDYYEAKIHSDIDDTIESLKLTKKALKDYFKDYNPLNTDTYSATDLKNHLSNIIQIDKVIKELNKDKLNEENSEGRITGGSEEGAFETFSII